jgi:hypothetical protein
MATLTTSNKQSTHRKKNKTIKIILLIVVGLLITFRLILPYIVLKYVNNKLSHLHEYYGHVEDINIALIRGAYVIKDIRIEKIEVDKKIKDTIPFFTSPNIDLSIEWRAIFKGQIVGEIILEKPVLNFVKGKHKDENVKTDTSDFRSLIKDLMPLTINHFEITGGEIHYIDQNSKPALDVSLKNIMINASNLSNVNKSSKLLPAYLMATGEAYQGTFELNVNFDALNKQPTFDLNAEIKHINLVLLNDMLRAYGNFDVQKGNFGLYTEFAAKNGEFGGYVKPIVKDLDVVQWNKQEGDFKQILWETLIGSTAEAFQNQRKDQFATKVPIQGKFDEPAIDLWKAITYVLRNAFVHALKPSIDNSINIHQLDDEKNKSIMDKIFTKKKKKK